MKKCYKCTRNRSDKSRREDRKKIEALNAQGKTVDEMAMAIGVHSATMYRELARGGEPYKAEVAQHSI